MATHYDRLQIELKRQTAPGQIAPRPSPIDIIFCGFLDRIEQRLNAISAKVTSINTSEHPE